MGFYVAIKNCMYEIKIQWECMLYCLMSICWKNEMINLKKVEKQDKNCGY